MLLLPTPGQMKQNDFCVLALVYYLLSVGLSVLHMQEVLLSTLTYVENEIAALNNNRKLRDELVSEI